jgi:murein L,D-transpeptidase YafK
MDEKEIEIKIKNLPENLKKDVIEYIDFLLKKYQNQEIKKRKLKFDWEDGLSEINKEFSSVELQHKSVEFR